MLYFINGINGQFSDIHSICALNYSLKILVNIRKRYALNMYILLAFIVINKNKVFCFHMYR